MKQVILIGNTGYIGKNLNIALKNRFNITGFSSKNINQLFKRKDYSGYSLIHLGQPSSKNYVFQDSDIELVSHLRNLKFDFYLYISSISISSYDFENKDFKKNEKLSDYNKLKLVSENTFESNQTTILRIGNVYANKPKKNTLLADIFNQIDRDQIIINNLISKIYFLWIDDLIDLIYKILMIQKSGKFNAFSNKIVSVKDILDYLIKKNYIDNNKKIINTNKIQNTNTLNLSSSKTKKLFSWNTTVNIFDYIDEYFNEKK